MFFCCNSSEEARRKQYYSQKRKCKHCGKITILNYMLGLCPQCSKKEITRILKKIDDYEAKLQAKKQTPHVATSPKEKFLNRFMFLVLIFFFLFLFIFGLFT